jgi:iron complex outermembrane recepter protein
MRIGDQSTLTASIHANDYRGLHYGKVPWIALTGKGSDLKWYDLNANKTDKSMFIKYMYKATQKWILFADVQARHVDYTIHGFRNNPTLVKTYQNTFVNPKAGINYILRKDQKKNSHLFYSFAMAQKEPNREDFENNIAPSHETLYDHELGMNYRTQRMELNTNLYSMNYKNQLVLTGKLNDVGAYTRTNVAISYRYGIELDMSYKVNKQWSLHPQIALSQNRIPSFTEFIWNNDSLREDALTYTNTQIAFSPNTIAACGIVYTNQHGIRSYSFQWLNKYVGRQYLDNTASSERSIAGYFHSDLIANYTPNRLDPKWNYRCTIQNLTHNLYVANGYTFGQIANGIRENYNYYYPQAGIRFMIGATYQMF